MFKLNKNRSPEKDTNKKLELTITHLLNFKEKQGIGFNFWKNSCIQNFPKTKKGFKYPKEWKIIEIKAYPRFPQIDLSFFINFKIKNDLFKILLTRRSERTFSEKPISLKEIANLIYFSCGVREKKIDFNETKRTYPSAGARYPLEVYIVNLKSLDFPFGLYHYNVKRNTLEFLMEGNFQKFFKETTNQAWVENSSIVVIITGIFERTTIKYGERGWRYIWLETGHLAQNIYLVATALKLKCCAIGGFKEDELIKFLDIEETGEVPLYLLALGK